MRQFTTISVVALALALAVGVADGPFAPRAAMAAPQVSQAVGKPLQAAQSLIAARNFKDALAKVNEAEGQANKSAYENFVIANLKGKIYAGLKDYNNAAKAMEAALATGQAQGNQDSQILRQIMSYYSQAGNNAKMIEVGQRYLKDNADPTVQMAVAQGYISQRNYKQAEELVRQAMAKSGGGGTKDQLVMLRFIAHETGNAAAEQHALEQLLQRFPSPEYWEAMLVTASKTIKGPTASLDILRIENLTGGLKNADEYMTYAQEALVQKLPAEAKKIVDVGLQKKVLGQGAQKDRHMRLVEMTNRQATEDQASLAQRDADAQAAATGDADVQLGVSYWTYGQYDKAIAAIQRGIKKGVKDKDDAQLRLGIAYISAGKRDHAATAFRAIKAGTAAARVARLWTLYAATR